MKITEKKMRFAFIFLVIMVVLFFFMKHVLLWPFAYENNSKLTREENREIKSLILTTMKGYHSTFFTLSDDLFTEEYRMEYPHYNKDWSARSIFVTFDSTNFMGTAEKVSDDEYNVTIQLAWPDDWCYYFTIKVIDSQYLISYYEIDP